MLYVHLVSLVKENTLSVSELRKSRMFVNCKAPVTKKVPIYVLASWNTVHLKKLIVAQLVKFPAFVEPEGSWHYSHKPVTSPCLGMSFGWIATPALEMQSCFWNRDEFVIIRSALKSRLSRTSRNARSSLHLEYTFTCRLSSPTWTVSQHWSVSVQFGYCCKGTRIGSWFLPPHRPVSISYRPRDHLGAVIPRFTSWIRSSEADGTAKTCKTKINFSLLFIMQFLICFTNQKSLPFHTKFSTTQNRRVRKKVTGSEGS